MMPAVTLPPSSNTAHAAPNTQKSTAPSAASPVAPHSEPSAAPTAAPPATRAGRAAAVVLLLALIALGLAWELWLAPTGSGTLAVKVLPLVLVLPGLLRHRMYTYRWLSLLLWLYVTEGLVRVYAADPMTTWLAATQVLLSVALFAVCGTYIRRRLKSVR